MPRRLFFLLLLVASLHAAAEDLYDTLNRQRAGGGACPAVAGMPALQPQPALERVARDLARGGEVKQSMKEHGFRALRTRVLTLKGEGLRAQAAEVLARQRYCAPLQDPELTQAGLHLEARELWLVLAMPFAPAVALSGEAAGQRVLELVNRARATPRQCGERAFKAARPVSWNAALAQASRLHAEDMARQDYIAHEGRDGSSPSQRVERAGYRFRATAENIAGGGKMQAEDAVAGWLRSPGHCVNVMNPAYTEMGAAYAVNPRSTLGIYWAQSFGRPR